MARFIQTNERTIVVKSAHKLEDYKFLQKYNSDALKVVDENGNTTYRVFVDDECSVFSGNGAVFSQQDSNGLATVTVEIPERFDSAEDFLMECLPGFDAVESRVASAVASIRERAVTIRSRIETL